MNTYKRHRFPPDTISYPVWLYYRFNLSHRDIEDLQAKRDGAAAKRFFRRLLRSHGAEPGKIVTDKLRSYGVADRELIPEAIHSTQQYENNRTEQSYEATSVRERGMRRFK